MSKTYNINVCIINNNSNPALTLDRDNIESLLSCLKDFLNNDVDTILECNISIVDSSKNSTIYYCLHDSKVFDSNADIYVHRNIIIDHFKQHVFDFM